MMQMRKFVTYAALAVGLVAAAALPAVAAHIGGGGMGGGVHIGGGMGGGMGHSMGPMGHFAHAGPMGHMAHHVGPMGQFAHASPMGHMAHVKHVGPMGGPRRVANFHDHDHGHGHHHGHNHFFIAAGYPYFYNDYYYDTGYGGCAYLYNRAVRTGSSYWWRRYEECVY